MKVQNKKQRQINMGANVDVNMGVNVAAKSLNTIDRCIETYRQVNGASFQKNFNVLIAHFKNTSQTNSPAFAQRQASSPVSSL